MDEQEVKYRVWEKKKGGERREISPLGAGFESNI
jgi:hypothetical protein